MPITPNPSAPALTKNDRAKILSTIKKLVAERHINVQNPNQDFAAWISLVEERMPSLIAEANHEAFEGGVSELLRALGSSHTAFFHQRRDNAPAPYSINATLRAVDMPEGTKQGYKEIESF